MNLQPQLKYIHHTNTMRQATIEHLLLKNTKKKPGKNKIFVEGFSFKEGSATHDNNDDDGDDDDDDDDNDFDVGDDS